MPTTASRRKPVRVSRRPEGFEELPTLPEFRKLDDEEKKEWADRFLIGETDDDERVLRLAVSIVYRKVKSLEGEYSAPGEKFLVDLIKLAGHSPLHFDSVWSQFQDFENNWVLRGRAILAGIEDEQDPNDEDPINDAGSRACSQLKNSSHLPHHRIVLEQIRLGDGPRGKQAS